MSTYLKQQLIPLYSPPAWGLGLNLNLYERHFSFIKNFDAYTQKYACGFCGRAFPTLHRLKQHTRLYDSRVKYTFPGGLYTPQKSVFEEMQQTLGIEVEANLQFYPWFYVYDFEAVLKKIAQETENPIQWITEHVPFCVSASSNVPGYEAPHSMIDSDPDNLFKRMCDYMEQIQSVTSALASERWSHVFEQLEALKGEFPVEAEANERDANVRANRTRDQIGVGVETGDNRAEDSEKPNKLYASRLISISDKFKKYACVLPVLGYNSSRYDLNLIKKYFPKHLNSATEADYIVKKSNEYSAIATSRFKFLDISNFLAAGCTYSKFLKAYDVSE